MGKYHPLDTSSNATSGYSHDQPRRNSHLRFCPRLGVAPLHSADAEPAQALVRAPHPTSIGGLERIHGTTQRRQQIQKTPFGLDTAHYLQQLRESQHELQNMAWACAYLEVSQTRLADNVTMYIRNNFVLALCSEIDNTLRRRLDSIAEPVFEIYAADDPVDAHNREVLSQTKSILVDAMGAMENLLRVQY